MRKDISGTAPGVVPPSVEIWRDIPGYEGAYQASSLGRIRSLPRLIPVYDSIRRVMYQRLVPGGILRQAVCDKAPAWKRCI